MNNSENSNTKDEAILSSADGFTAFRFGGYNIRFRAPYSLERYVDVVKSGQWGQVSVSRWHEDEDRGDRGQGGQVSVSRRREGTSRAA